MLTQNRDLADIDQTAPTQLAPLPNPIYPVVRVFLYIALAFVVVPLALLPFSLGAAVVGEVLGAVFAVSMLLSALITTLCAWPVSRRLKRFRQGDYLAHWTYSEDEWLAFADGEWEHQRQDAGKMPRLGLLIGGLGGFFCGGAAGCALFHNVLGVVLGAVAGTLLFGLVGALIGWLSGCVMRFAGWRRYQRMRERVGETYIGENAVYCDGLYWSWTMPGWALAGMELVPGRPAVLVFNLLVYYGRRGGVVKKPYRAPVPAGREEEARRILHMICGN